MLRVYSWRCTLCVRVPNACPNDKQGRFSKHNRSMQSRMLSLQSGAVWTPGLPPLVIFRGPESLIQDNKKNSSNVLLVIKAGFRHSTLSRNPSVALGEKCSLACFLACFFGSIWYVVLAYHTGNVIICLQTGANQNVPVSFTSFWKGRSVNEE